METKLTLNDFPLEVLNCCFQFLDPVSIYALFMVDYGWYELLKPIFKEQKKEQISFCMTEQEKEMVYDFLTHAATKDCWTLFIWGQKNGAPVTYQHGKLLASKGKLRLLQKFNKEHLLKRTWELYCPAACSGSINTFKQINKWFGEPQDNMQTRIALTTNFTLSGNTRMLSYVYFRKQKFWLDQAFWITSIKKNLTHLFKWAKKVGLKIEAHMSDFLTTFLCQSTVKTVKSWIKNGFTLKRDSLGYAIRFHNNLLFLWLYKQKICEFIGKEEVVACSKANLYALQFLKKIHPIFPKPISVYFNIAAKYLHIKVLEWLKDEFGDQDIEWQKDIHLSALHNDNAEILKFLLDHDYPYEREKVRHAYAKIMYDRSPIQI
jgi:hypothetical protein